MNAKLQHLMSFYEKINARSLEIISALAEQGLELQCQKGCHDCCHDDLSLTPIEAEFIRIHFKDVLRTKPHPKGKCAFLDEDGACRIYPARPYICRSQGLPLRWIQEDPKNPEAKIEYRDICKLNTDVLPEKQSVQNCFTLGIPQLTLQEINALDDQTKGEQKPNAKRIAMRSLFDND